MIRQVNIEPIDLRQDFLETPPITRDEAIAAFEACVKQVEANMDYFQDKFPWSATKELKYPIIENIEWTDGFNNRHAVAVLRVHRRRKVPRTG